MIKTIIALALGVAVTAPATAAITWTDWTSASTTAATGTLGSIIVTERGDLDNWQVTGGTDFWRTGGGTAFAAYDAVSNLPGNNDFIAPTTNQQLHTFLFSAPVTNPYLAIISLGRTNLNSTWTFDQAWSFVDQGAGFFGNGLLTQTGNTLSSGEGHGIIRFRGTFTKLELVTNDVEFWSGLTFGISAVPETATWMTLIAGFGLVGAVSRRRRSNIVSA